LPKKLLAGSGRNILIQLVWALKCAAEEKLGYDDDMEEESLGTQEVSGCANLCGEGCAYWSTNSMGS